MSRLLSLLIASLLCASAISHAQMPARPAASGSGDPARDIPGEWIILIGGKSRYQQAFLADHSCWRAGRHFAVWEIKGSQLVVVLDDATGVDTFELPIVNGASKGTNLVGWQLMLCRLDQPIPPALQAQFLGTWFRLDTLSPGPPETVAFQPNGLYAGSTGHEGFWHVLGDRLFVDYNKPSLGFDVYALPVTNETLSGKRGANSILTLSRQPLPEGSPPPAASGDKPPDTYFGSHKQ